MDVASRFEPRVRAQPVMQQDDSGNDSDSLSRRKFQRTSADVDASSGSIFRKPLAPASATRQPAEQRSSLSQRRRITQHRENVRVPSGPREFPSPGRRVGNSSISSLTPSMADSTNTSRSFLPHTTSEPLFGRASEGNRFSFGNPSSNDDTDSPTTPAERLGDNFEFLPSVNFDDFQNSLADYDSTRSLLSEFPTLRSDKSTPKEHTSSVSMDRAGASESSRPPIPKVEPREEVGVGRSQSLRKRLSAVTGSKQTAGRQPSKDTGSTQASHLSHRARRQSSVPQTAQTGPAVPSAGVPSRAPRKSVGPGLITSMMDNRKSSQQQADNSSASNLKNTLPRTASVSKSTRRTTMQPVAPASAEPPRSSTLTASTQSRQNKVKSLLPPARDADPNTPISGQPQRANNLRAQTPSSSGNKRQSTISGRASGLGARTISPTDARRLKRLSMMQAPPMPSAMPKGPPTPQEELPPMRIEMPRLTQPSPSLIPRKTNSSTPPSARASPDGRYGSGVSLSSKSSFQSLVHSSASQSRLPTPKPRSVHSSSAQYGDGEEIVPPVPAIPKAYESPRENETPFFSGIGRASQSSRHHREPTMSEFDPEGSFMSMPLSATSTKTAAEAFAEARRKPSGEYKRGHRRTNTTENGESGSISSIGQKVARPQPDPAGRKNNNLQPLRLPPLNLAPINSSTTSKIAGLPRPSQEVEDREQPSYAQTPEPKRTAKTPSTPMTASKATFFQRHNDEHANQKSMRSASSHFALRDLLHMDGNVTKFFDDSSDAEIPGLPIAGSRHRSAITPFSSGSLPKASGEFARNAGRPSAEYDDAFSLGKYENLRLQKSMPQGQPDGRRGTETSSLDSPVADATQPESKKESSSGGLRRKLSLGWRRSSSKVATSADHKSMPQQDGDKAPSKLQKRASEMPPPRLPASATWSGDIPTVSTATRPSLDSTRRKSTAISINSLASIGTGHDADHASVAPPKVSNLRAEVSAGNRSSSWGNMESHVRPVSMRPAPHGSKSRAAQPAPTLSAIVKDKDDLAADEEMRRLSQKRRDVDTAARESEDLKRRASAKSPMSPEQVLHDRTCALNIFERGEVMDFEKEGVYFTGTKTARKIVGSVSGHAAGDKDSKAGNYGYDDERGDYSIVLGDHLAYRYEVVDVLGKGSFGQVVRCVDHKDGGVVAVKIIRNKKRFHQQALVEVGILGRLREWDPDGAHATLSITSSFYFRSHLCIVTPCLSINLYEFIRAHNFTGFSLPLIRRFSRQLLACLVLLQNRRIIHCDMKPENILLCEARKADVRVIDFGSSCKEEEKVYTYIQSRFYRSPEVILGSSYGLGIDMWSLGCILAELWTGYPIFPGENEQEQLACIMEIFGPPDRHMVERCTRKKLFFDSVGKPRVTVSSKGRRRRPSSKTLSQALKTDDEAFLDFISRCLRWDPDRRMKPNEAITHPFITNQPFHQRAGIPDEARRAARLRPTAAIPTGSGMPSPIKRTQTTAGVISNTLSQQGQQTPARERRPLPETPQTAVRSAAPASTTAQTRGSPSKPVASTRRFSTATSANAAAVAGSKRASNGAVVGAGLSAIPVGQRYASGGNASTGSLAALAARESMGTAANAAKRRS